MTSSRSTAALSGLVWTIVRTDFKTRYHGTMGGFLWAFSKPLAMFAVLWSVFSYVFEADPHYSLNLILGLFVYDFFTEASKTALVALRVKGYLLARARFPAWVLVVTSASNAVITLACFTFLMVVVLAIGGRAPGIGAVALFLAYQAWLLAVVLGGALAASVLFLRFRDLNQIWEVVTQAGFFLAPIIYPLSILPDWAQTANFLWPPTAAIMFGRAVLVDGVTPSLWAHVALIGMATLVVWAGALVYRRHAPHAAEHL